MQDSSLGLNPRSNKQTSWEIPFEIFWPLIKHSINNKIYMQCVLATVNYWLCKDNNWKSSFPPLILLSNSFELETQSRKSSQRGQKRHPMLPSLTPFDVHTFSGLCTIGWQRKMNLTRPQIYPNHEMLIIYEDVEISFLQKGSKRWLFQPQRLY